MKLYIPPWSLRINPALSTPPVWKELHHVPEQAAAVDEQPYQSTMAPTQQITQGLDVHLCE
jgi:hypothetical protein